LAAPESDWIWRPHHEDAYTSTVRQLLEIAPVVFSSHHFAIKGGTALNLFLNDLPRLSVDIDVVFTNHSLDRESALQAIAAEPGQTEGQEAG
jgi:predicted nucleotidyltransferase component of viral defense system